MGKIMDGKIYTKEIISSRKRNGLKKIDADEEVMKIWKYIHLDDCYEMNENKYVLVFNINHLGKEVPSLSNGTPSNGKFLEEVFSKLGFTVKKYDIIDYNDITKLTQEFIKQDHTKTSCVCVVILDYSYGRGDMCACDKSYDIRDMLSIFDNAHELNDKPKLFLIQSTAVKNEKHKEDDKNVRIKMNTRYFGADTIIAYSTAYEDFLPKNETSWIDHLCLTIGQFPQMDILDILTMVNATIIDSNSYNSVPQSQSTLTKPFKFAS